jgi:hypothetical protein
MNSDNRSYKGQISFTKRDLRVLLWIAEQSAACFDHVWDLLEQYAGPEADLTYEISESAARQIIARWQRAGWIAKKKVLFEDPFWIWPTTHVLHLLELPYKAYEPSLSRLNHIYAVNAVRLSIEDVWPDYHWISERQIRADLHYKKGDPLPHIPDAKLITDKGALIILEVEITPKRSSDLFDILVDLTNTYLTIWYFVTDQVRPTLEAALSKLDPALAANVFLFSYSATDGIDESEGWAHED